MNRDNVVERDFSRAGQENIQEDADKHDRVSGLEVEH